MDLQEEQIYTDEQLIRILEGGDTDPELDECTDSDVESEDEPQAEGSSTAAVDGEGPPTAAVIVEDAEAALPAAGHRPNWVEEDNFTPEVHDFDEFTTGINPSVPLIPESEAIDFFEIFMTLQFVQYIADQCNKKYRHFVANSPLSQHSRFRGWIDATAHDIYVFFAITMLMTRNRHLTIEEHWARDPLLISTIFGNLMSRNRYCMLLGMLGFLDPEAGPSDDKLIKIRWLITFARNKFKEVFYPNGNLCIDESILVFKGRLAFKQYLPMKRHRFGIKLFLLCDVKTRYILDFIVYCGANTDLGAYGDLGVSGAVVATLMEPYLNKGHRLFVDNWYTSPQLFLYLHEKLTNACGTVKKNRKGMPAFGNVERGQCQSKTSGPLMALKWKDKKDVHMLTSMHKNEFLQSKIDYRTGLPKMKPACVIEYSKNMGSIDQTDMMLSKLSCIRKTIKWPKKFGLHIVDMFLMNAHGLYCSVKESVPLADFQLNVIRQIIAKYGTQRPVLRQNPGPNIDSPLRLRNKSIADHMPALIEVNGRIMRRQCHVCSHTKLRPKKRQLVKYQCKPCDVSLCAAPCFMEYHKLSKY